MRAQSFRPTRAGRRRLHPVVLAIIVVVLLAAFSLGYHRGMDRHYKARLRAAGAVEAKARSSLKSCRDAREALMHDRAKSLVHDAAAVALEEELRAVKGQLEEREGANSNLTSAVLTCHAQSASLLDRVQEQSRADAMARAEVVDVQQRVHTLRAQLSNMTGGLGEAALMSFFALRSLRSRYVALCSSIPGCVVGTDTEMLQQFAHYRPNITADAQKIAARERKLVSHFPPPVMPHSPSLEKVLLHSAAPAADTFRFFNRSVGRVYGYTEDSAVPVGPRWLGADGYGDRLELLLDMSLCALRRQYPQFVVPSAFSPRGVVEANNGPPTVRLLHEHVTGPFVRMCVSCASNISPSLAMLGCLDDRVHRHYGGEEFWTVRSRLLPAPGVAAAATAFFEGLEITGNDTAAVVYHPPGLASSCQGNALPPREMHYLYLRRNFPNDTALARSVAPSAVRQCAPLPADVIAGVEEMVRGADPPYRAVYLSVPVKMREEIFRILESDGKTELRQLMHYFRPLSVDAKPPMAEAVDVEIAARARSLLISSYFRTSGHVAESYLLRHGMDPSGGIRFF